MDKKILIVEDEKKIVDIIAFNLKKEGYEVLCAYDGEEGLSMALSENPELIILDIMMPKMDGFEVCRQLREKNIQTPIIMLTARAEETDKVLGLEIGADDYVTKPFGVKELMARIKSNIRRRVTDLTPEKGDALVFGEITIYPDKYEIYRKGELVELTRREFEIVKFLASNQTQVFSREALLEKIWGYEYFGDVRSVDVTIRRLRAKIEENSESPRYILTKRAVGYYFSGGQ